jgi:hypothetical protein
MKFGQKQTTKHKTLTPLLSIIKVKLSIIV